MVESWNQVLFKDIVRFTQKPKDLKISFPLPFVPMDLVPLDKIEIKEFTYVDRLTSGNYVEDGDLLLAKITPSFENGKQGILSLGHPFAYATTEVIPFKGLPEVTDTLFLSFFLKQADLRKELAGKMEGSTGRQRLSKTVLDNLKILLPPIQQQRKIAFILQSLQKAIEHQSKLIEINRELKRALMLKLFTEGTKGEKQKETEIGLVPKSWEIVPLGKYAYIENGFAFKSQHYVKEGIPLIRISNVSHGFFISKDNKYLPQSFLTKYEKFSLKSGDLIVSLTRPVTSGGLKYCFVEGKDLPALLNQRVGRFQVRENLKLTKDFLYHLVFTHYFVGELYKLFGNSSQQPNVSPSQLEGFKVPIPAIDEQNNISEILFSLDKKIRICELKQKSFSDLFHALLNELMTAKRSVHNINLELKKNK